MPSPGEHKTVLARILAYVQEIGWSSYASREWGNAVRMHKASLFFNDLDRPTDDRASCPGSRFIVPDGGYRSMSGLVSP